MFEWAKRRINELDVDFVRWQVPTWITSLTLVVLSWILFAAIGPNWGIDFTGGTEIMLQFHDDTQITDVRHALKDLGLAEDSVQQVNDPSEHEFAIRIQDATFGSKEMKADVESRLKKAFGDDWIDFTKFDAEVGARLAVHYKGDPVTPQQVAAVLSDIDGVVVQLGREDREVVIKMPGLTQQIGKEINSVMTGHKFAVLSVEAVGPKVGGELRRQGFISVFATLALVLLYVAFRFELAFAPGAVLALVHDVSLTAGVFVITQREFDLPMIGALLTIVGYSLNDTIVIYDRIRENKERYRRRDMRELINVSINETLSRTLATSGTTILAITAFLFMGGPVIEDFAFAMTFGIFVGTYSTIYVASPMILLMQRIQPWLTRVVAGGGAAPADEDEQGPERPLTQAEQRRRERAQHDGASSV